MHIWGSLKMFPSSVSPFDPLWPIPALHFPNTRCDRLALLSPMQFPPRCWLPLVRDSQQGRRHKVCKPTHTPVHVHATPYIHLSSRSLDRPSDLIFHHLSSNHTPRRLHSALSHPITLHVVSTPRCLIQSAVTAPTPVAPVDPANPDVRALITPRA